MKQTVDDVVPYWMPEFDRLRAAMRGYQGRGVLYLVVTIPRSPASDEVELADAGHWPVRLQLEELPAQDREMIDFLIDRVASQWPTS